METKQCKKCGIVYPVTSEFFKPNKRCRNGYCCTCRSCDREYMKNYRAQLKVRDPERYKRLLDSKKEYDKVRADRIKECKKAWRELNIDEVRNQAAKRRLERKKSDPMFAWVEWARARVYGAYKGIPYANDSTVEFTGLTLHELRMHLLATFKNTYGYEWDGAEKVHVDHIVPLDTEETLDGKKKLFHYTNLRLIRAKDNIAKRNHLNYEIK